MARRTPGRKIDTWAFRTDSGVYEIPVKMLLDKGQARFRAQSTELDVDDTDVNLNALKKRVEIAVKAKSEIEWTELLVIRVDFHSQTRSRSYGDDAESKVEFEWGTIWEGAKPNGKLCWRRHKNGGEVREGDPRKSGKVLGWGKVDLEVVLSYTKESAATAESLRLLFKAFRNALVDTIHTDQPLPTPEHVIEVFKQQPVRKKVGTRKKVAKKRPTKRKAKRR